MLAINERNLNLLKEGKYSLKQIVRRYNNLILDVDENVKDELLKSGELDKSDILKTWTGLDVYDLHDNADSLSKYEIRSLLHNPVAAKATIGCNTSTVSGLPYVTNNIQYSNLSPSEAIDWGVTLADVIHNAKTSLSVKRALIEKEYGEYALPVSTVDDLHQYATIDINPETVSILRNLKSDIEVIVPDLLRQYSLRKYDDITSRCILSLCSRYREKDILNILNGAGEFEQSSTFYSNLRSPDTATETNQLFNKVPENGFSSTYLASCAKLSKRNFHDILQFVMDFGTEADLLALYQNYSSSKYMQDISYDDVSILVPRDTYRAGMFGKYIEDCSKSILHDFCNMYLKEQYMFFYLQTAEAFKRSSIYAIKHMRDCNITLDEVLVKCTDTEFSNSEAEDLLDIIEVDYDIDAATRFILTDTIPDYLKSEAYKVIKH